MFGGHRDITVAEYTAFESHVDITAAEFSRVLSILLLLNVLRSTVM